MKNNIPVVKLGIVAVSRDCFPIELSRKRLVSVQEAYERAFGNLFAANVIIECEADVSRALGELQQAKVNALVIYLGNFGPEGPETLLAQRFNGPVMLAAAEEERGDDLINGRGDAYCGLLNASYSLGLRGIKCYIPEKPIGSAAHVAELMNVFSSVACVVIGVRALKIITFGPRPQDFLACNAPIKPLYDLGLVGIQENSELDLLDAFKKHENDARIPDLQKEMQIEVGEGPMTGVIPRLAQYELTLMDWVKNNSGAADYVVMANKCWPAFAGNFGCVPCYVNSRFSSRLMPIACEVDIYGALSEFMVACATHVSPSILDINNTVPADIYEHEIKGKYPYSSDDIFMAFHCGNTPIEHLVKGDLKYQFIMKRGIEPDSEPDLTRGTLEGDIKPGNITLFRLQSSADCQLRAYIAQGEVLPIATRSFGSIGIFAVREMIRFYRHVLIEKQYPHHAAVGFGKAGTVLFEALKFLGVDEVDYNREKGSVYPGENPFFV